MAHKRISLDATYGQCSDCACAQAEELSLSHWRCKQTSGCPCILRGQEQGGSHIAPNATYMVESNPSSICTSSSFPLPWPGLHNEKLWNQFLFILNELKVFLSWLPGAAGFHTQLEVRSQVPHSFWRLEFPSFGTLATGGILNEARLALLAWEELLLFTSPRIYPRSHGQNENPRSISWLLASHPPSSWTFKSDNYDGNLGP